jgi:hypothetical protein
MKFNRVRLAFVLLTVFAAVQFADLFDKVPANLESERQSISIRSNDLPIALAHSHNRSSSEVCEDDKPVFTADFLEVKRLYSVQVQIRIEQNIYSLIGRPTTPLYVLFLQILI